MGPITTFASIALKAPGRKPLPVVRSRGPAAPMPAQQKTLESHAARPGFSRSERERVAARPRKSKHLATYRWEQRSPHPGARARPLSAADQPDSLLPELPEHVQSRLQWAIRQRRRTDGPVRSITKQPRT